MWRDNSFLPIVGKALQSLIYGEGERYGKCARSSLAWSLPTEHWPLGDDSDQIEPLSTAICPEANDCLVGTLRGKSNTYTSYKTSPI